MSLALPWLPLPGNHFPWLPHHTLVEPSPFSCHWQLLPMIRTLGVAMTTAAWKLCHLTVPTLCADDDQFVDNEEALMMGR